jgi:predicted kinase
MGIPGSGKSYATQMLFNQREDALIINPDAIRYELTGDAADQTQNADVFKIAHHRLVCGLLDPGTNIVVFDATNVQQRARQTLLAICAEHDALTALIVFDIDFGLCAQRNDERDRTVPLHAMVRMQTDFEKSLDQVGSEGWDDVKVIESATADGVVTRPLL